jgi:hypothetical protein
MGGSLENAPLINLENASVMKKRLLIVKAIVFGLILALLSLGVSRIMERSGLAWIEDNGAALVIGLLGGFIFYCLFLQDAVVREVNHHVRNALQVMLYPQDAGDVRYALKRIDWTLSNVIRGRFERSLAEEEERTAAGTQHVQQPIAR